MRELAAEKFNLEQCHALSMIVSTHNCTASPIAMNAIDIGTDCTASPIAMNAIDIGTDCTASPIAMNAIDIGTNCLAMLRSQIDNTFPPSANYSLKSNPVWNCVLQYSCQLFSHASNPPDNLLQPSHLTVCLE